MNLPYNSSFFEEKTAETSPCNRVEYTDSACQKCEVISKSRSVLRIWKRSPIWALVREPR